MSNKQKAGAAAYVIDKAGAFYDYGNIAFDAADPATREQAMFDAATKLTRALLPVVSNKLRHDLGTKMAQA